FIHLEFMMPHAQTTRGPAKVGAHSTSLGHTAQAQLRMPAHAHGRAVRSQRERRTAAAAGGGRAGVVPAAVHGQVRQLQPVLPGARGRAAGGAGHHGVLPGGVAVQVRQPALHAM
uniref:Uncharacterized protein n=1 Tax=Aegilops tauschii subsp. strangulata TaxID=200361 RepID=A0A453FU35_AEGTS